MKSVSRFTFPDHVEAGVIESLVGEAIRGVEALYGKPRVRRTAGYLVGRDPLRLVIDTSTQIGEQVADLFTGALLRHLDEDDFSVELVSTGLDQEEV